MSDKYVEGSWYDDPDEVAKFARWFFEGATARAGEVIDVFEKPWKWDEEYQGMEADLKAELEESARLRAEWRKEHPAGNERNEEE